MKNKERGSTRKGRLAKAQVSKDGINSRTNNVSGSKKYGANIRNKICFALVFSLKIHSNG